MDVWKIPSYCVSEANEDTNVRGVAYGTVKRRALALAVVVVSGFAKKHCDLAGEATRDVSRQNTIVGGASALRRRRDGGPWEGWTGESVAGFRIHVSGGPTHGRNAGAWHASTWPPPGSRTNAYISPSEAVKPSRAGPDPTTLSRGPPFAAPTAGPRRRARVRLGIPVRPFRSAVHAGGLEPLSRIKRGRRRRVRPRRFAAGRGGKRRYEESARFPPSVVAGAAGRAVADARSALPVRAPAVLARRAALRQPRHRRRHRW